MSSKGVKRKRSGADEDIISNLPRNLIACILGKMPIREAVRTSVFSKKWRYYYLNIPQLVFDDQFCKELDDFSVNKGANIYALKFYQFDEIITKSLMLHPGGLERFKVCIPFNPSPVVPYVNKWILCLSFRKIKELTLIYKKVYTDHHHKLPPSFFSCLHLTSLKLINFVRSPPLEFKGFPNLRHLILSGVDFTNNCFESFISSCPILKRLFLGGCSGIHHFNISGSKLQRLFTKADDNFKSISLEKAPNLSEVYVSLGGVVKGPEENGVFDLVSFIGSLPEVKVLSVDSKFLQVSANRNFCFKYSCFV
uniref:F-box/FBD/LRR-repeat protein At1g13570-like n=1 Tax=Nicotiana tabacum TaxID=4097 RepID=A0A1S4ARX6_TOBAC|nr:PREDICTED: F-box/FBD/LRR-repeat protein At1g13570-like [Nicotiana tabacum]